jgi:hypothetical protein
MSLTTEQLQTLKAAMLADPALTQFIADRRDDLVADYYNAPAVPTFIIWRTFVTQDEIMQNGFDWTRVDNLSVGKSRIWEWMFNNEARAFNPSKTNVRAGIDATWVGTAADLAQRAAVYVHCKRPANRVERLFASGVGTDVAPGLLGYEGTLSVNEVSNLLNEV